ncbi:MAG: rod shape-determining protein RodA [Candidatus Dadabacteria bacterium]|nr:MAG: rod shape-determining protein RodA [Candidatus Dadabacteria bacterium]
MTLDRRYLSQFDWWLFAVSLLIPLAGLTVLYSAGYDPGALRKAFSWLPGEYYSATFVRQGVFLIAGIIVALITIAIPTQKWERYSYLIYFMALLSLVAVLLFGQSSHGSRRWLLLGGIRIQPSEFVKVALILAVARYISKHPPPVGGYGFKNLIPLAIIIGLPMALIVRQPDLGTALAVGAIGAAMTLFAGIKPKVLAILAAAVLIAAVPLWESLKPYQQRRIMALLDSESDARGSGYHVNQSKIAIGSGGFSGKGFLKGTQTQLEFLPEHTTDFVFAVLAEEWGFLGSVCVLALYFLLIYRILRVTLKSYDLFPALVAFGVAFLVFFHMAVNIGMVLGMLPVVGLPLPLFSYGGSSMLTVMFAIGLVLGISMRRLTFIGKIG